MKLITNHHNIQGEPTEATLTHQSQEIKWDIALFDKVSYKGDYDIFEQINQYWEKLPSSTQDKIFEVYRAIKETFNVVWDTDELTKQLYVLVRDLYVYHDLADIKHWKDFYSTLMTPIHFEDLYREGHEASRTRERTYLKDDYQWLVTLTIALRPMIPIWGEFITRTRKDKGTAFKEYYALKLMAYANIAASEPMERLRVYVEHSIPADKSKAAAIFAGLSSDEFPTWILGLVLVRRLSVGDVRGLDPKTHLITYIHGFIIAKVKGLDNNFLKTIIKDKPIEGQGQEGENNLSRIEGYKIKQEIPAGDIALLGYYMRDVSAIARKICPDIPLELLDASLISVQVLETEQIWEPQIILMQWVLKREFPPRGLLHLSKPLTLRAMAVTQALLWHRGYFELAGLLSAVEQVNTGEIQCDTLALRAIPKEAIERLHVLFPYVRKSLGKAKATKQISVADDAIKSVAELFSIREWKLTLPNDWVATVTGNKYEREYLVPSEIKIKLASLAIALAERSF